MDIAFEHKIRQRAYEIWMAAGMVDGAADEHWLRAKDDVLNETQTPVVAKARTVKAKPAAKPAVAAKSKAAAPKTAPKAAKPAVKAVRKPAAPETRASV